MRRRALLSTAAATPLLAAKLPDPRAVSFELWDVFSGEHFRGNPLAVFPHATSLPESQLGEIAREMGQSETTFVFPRAAEVERREGVRTRIFSRTGIEMPFAGHPVLGTAFALWHMNRQRTDVKGRMISLLLPVGQVPVAFRQREDKSWEGEMTQPDPVFAEVHRAEDLAPLLGLRVEEIDATLPIQNVSTGRPNLLVMLKSRAAVRQAAFDWRGLDAYFSKGDRERGVYLLTRDAEQATAQFHARKVTRLGDDPVTGSAAGCAIAWLVRHGVVPSGKRIVIEQGSEVKRRGQLFATAERAGERVTAVKVGGQAVRSARGELERG